ncbi:uncharacterized protein LOC124368940 isoform X2 [Homalodisca vitripennis]|uniref:uncharacterized protein LOC124368940 isoform X2 n=1 Tax=Homalodisca vitripennis TaxID=197043 RepID=UPI001EEBA67E|nr:uncharacterized protein LOC124368940 isoform X2 [Homalodisca vitripennis]
MIRLLIAATLAVTTTAEPYGLPYGYGPGYFHALPQSSPVIISAPSPPLPQPLPLPPVIIDQVEAPVFVPGPPLPGPPAPPLGVRCTPCTGPDCCELCPERTCAVAEDMSLLELALNPFFYVQYVEDCQQSRYLDNVCFLFVPLLDLSSLFTFGQVITYQDGTVEQRQYQIECVDDAFQFTAIGSGCKFKFEIIYADILCGVYVMQRCFENSCCQVDSGPIQIVSNLLPASGQCISDALEYVKNLYPCKNFIELPQENASLCTLLGATLSPRQG